MRFAPQRAGWSDRARPFATIGFIAAAMHLAIVRSTQEHGELIAVLAAEHRALREAQVIGIRGLADRKRRA